MSYNRRDIIGHWVTKQTRTQQMCQHACCRGYRVHPQNYPVILPNPLLRKASENDLAWHYEHAGSEKARAQVLHELDRRDQADRRKAARHEEHQRRMLARSRQRSLARHEERDRIYFEMEKQTHGQNLNAAGREKARRGELDDRDLLTGPDSRVYRYGSDELIRYFESNPRPTGDYFAGKRTTLNPAYGMTHRPRYRVA